MSWFGELGGRYGPFVIPAYAFAALVLAAMTLDTLWRSRRWRRAADRALRSEPEERPPRG